VGGVEGERSEGFLEDAEGGIGGVWVGDEDGFVEADGAVVIPEEFGGGVGGED
jgi:hypothetical protein